MHVTDWGTRVASFLPEGVKLEDVKATFADGVLEVRVPLPARLEPAVRKVEIQEPAKASETAA
jgi:hypothetical protein